MRRCLSVILIAVPLTAAVLAAPDTRAQDRPKEKAKAVEELNRRSVGGQGIAHQAPHPGQFVRPLIDKIVDLARIGCAVEQQHFAIERAAVCRSVLTAVEPI